jgi:hypothetical protein
MPHDTPPYLTRAGGDPDAALKAMFALADAADQDAALPDSAFTAQVFTQVRRAEAVRVAVAQTLWVLVGVGLALLAMAAWPQLVAMAPAWMSAAASPAAQTGLPLPMLASVLGGAGAMALAWWVAERA